MVLVHIVGFEYAMNGRTDGSRNVRPSSPLHSLPGGGIDTSSWMFLLFVVVDIWTPSSLLTSLCRRWK